MKVDEELFKPDDHNGPNWWTGNAVQPRVVQHRGAAIIAYAAQEIQRLLFGKRTHAWFPKAQFEETRGPEKARCNHDDARWFFGRAADSYVALFCAREATWSSGGPWRDSEIRAEGDTNIFVLQIGDAAEFGSFEGFVSQVRRARVHVSGLHAGQLQCSYDVPHGQPLELNYEDGPRYGGRPLQDDGFPRWRNPYTRIAWQQDRYAIQHRRRSLVHDVVEGTRKVGGHLPTLVHSTPLTFYAQNTALLPWPLYKGVDSDRARDHLINVLRERKPDVVGLSEVWTSDDRDRIVEELESIYPHHLDGPHDPLLETPLGDVEFFGGGLLLLSRHPIVASEGSVYRQCSGDDCLTNKGVLHARISPRGHPCDVDVFLSHTQAPHPTVGGTTAGARVAVEAQIRHLGAFIAACRDAVAPAVLMGDLNVDWFAHRDLYDLLISTLGFPVDLAPTVNFLGAARPTATSESDNGTISSFHSGRAARPSNDPARFGPTAERLDYVLSFPGLLYEQHVEQSQVVIEQWEPGRDLSDHYGLTATIDTTIQHFPEDRPISAVRARLHGFRCLQTSGGIGDDEVRLRFELRPAVGASSSQETREVDDVEAGTRILFDLPTLEAREPGGEIELVIHATEIDTLSADDDLGSAIRAYTADELLAIADRGPTRLAFPLLRGDDAEYVVEIVLTVEAAASELTRTKEAVRSSG